ncbi:MAG: NUDIX domain-containing protein [Actinomycetota bacterium]|nr:NUDIX domain-containing protein [Actinomycetota bacterium]
MAVPEPGDEIVDVVDDRDLVLRQATRREVRAQNLLHRVVAVLCRRTGGDVFVHRRSDSKDVFPGHYDMFVAGMVGAGERYEAAAARELAEELGVGGVRLREVFRHLYVGRQERAWSAVYEVRWDGEIRIDPGEVAWGGWLAPEELERRLEEWTFCPDSLETWARGRREGAW